jgi:hypothetical protein
LRREEPKAHVPFGNGFAVRSTDHFGPKVPMNHTPQRPVTSESTQVSHFNRLASLVRLGKPRQVAAGRQTQFQELNDLGILLIPGTACKWNLPRNFTQSVVVSSLESPEYLHVCRPFPPCGTSWVLI